MPRKKNFIEEEVIERAMYLFWRNGYETTSVRMLEKEMGINQFSMYSSFGSKEGVFIESIKCYKKKAQVTLVDKLKSSSKGVLAIKQYFYDFVSFSKDLNQNKGCLLTNTINELGENTDTKIRNEIMKFALNVRNSFIEKLKTNSPDEQTIEKQANYLMVSLQGLSVSSKMFEQSQLDDFIESVFERL